MDLAYRHVFNLSPSAGIISDENGMILQVNNSTEHLFGYDRALLIGQKMNFLVPQLPQISSKQSVGEFLAQRQNGITFPIELNSISFESENTVLISWVAIDISKNKELLAELKERVKERLTLLLVTETLFKFESLEEIFIQTLPHIAQGLQHSEHTGVCIKLKDGIEYKTANFRETKNPLSAIITYNGKEYGQLEVCYTIPFPHYLDSPFLQEEKELIDALAKLFSIFLDQWHTLTKLHEKDALIRKITEQIPGNTYQFELDAAGNIYFLFASKGFASNNLNVSAMEMRSNPNQILKLIHPDDWERFINSMKTAYENLTEIDIQYRVISDGDDSWRWLKATPEKDKAGKAIWYGSTQDITQIINYIDVLEQVLFDISHVMRKPVATMLGLTNFLLEHENMDEKTLQDFAKHIRSVAGEIDQYIKNLNDTYVQKRHSINTATGQTLFQLLSKHKSL